jgi:hypothetical protein
MLHLPDGEVLMHGDSTYDPAKAREYYLRTRKLKGRQKGVSVVPAGQSSASGPVTVSRAVTISYKGKSYKLSSKQYAEQKAYAAQRVGEIKTKIHKLESALKVKMAEARKNDAKSKKGPTAADKHQKAKDSAKYRDKHKQQLANKAKKSADKAKADHKKPDLNTVTGLKTAIKSAKSNLNKAVERQRALTTASKG